MTQEKMTQLSEVLKDEQFVSRLTSTADPKAAVALLAQKGVEITEAELAEAVQLMSKDQGELDEGSLENVAGGIIGPILPIVLRPDILRKIAQWGIAWVERWLQKDLNGNGKIGK